MNLKDIKEHTFKQREFFYIISNYVEEELNQIPDLARNDVPILLEKICNFYDIRVEYIDLNQNLEENTIIDRTMGKLVVYKDGNNGFATIYIDKKASYLVKRYTLAHEISHFLLERDIDNKKSIQTASLLFPGFMGVDVQEIIVDYIAMLILIPEKFLENGFNDIMKKKEESNEFDIDMELMLLSQKAQVPLYVLTIAYHIYKIKNIKSI